MLNPDTHPSHLPKCIIGNIQKPTQTGTKIIAQLQNTKNKDQ